MGRQARVLWIAEQVLDALVDLLEEPLVLSRLGSVLPQSELDIP